MAKYTPEFNVREYELRNTLPYYLSPDQEASLALRTQRVSSQLDWVAQLLGWSGNQYWSSLVSTVDQRRQLLAGTFGVYNSYVYPEVVEVRNWENCVVIKPGIEVLVGDTFYVGGNTYTPNRVENLPGGEIGIYFERLDSIFYTAIEEGDQFKLRAKRLLPAPFNREDVGASADYDFHCFEAEEGVLGLSPSFNLDGSLPLKKVVLFKRGKYSFDKPVSLVLSVNNSISPTYNPSSSRWEIIIPCNPEATGLFAELSWGNLGTPVEVRDWVDPSDWYQDSVIDGFKGVWSNKGGVLPIHFCFDALSLHGYNHESSLQMEPVRQAIAFDRLLNFVYLQKAHVDSLPPPENPPHQVWWNSRTGVFSIYNQDPANCGPWVEVEYPQDPRTSLPPDYVFPNYSAFQSFTEEFLDRNVVLIENTQGLGSDNNVKGLFNPLLGEGSATLVWSTTANGWLPEEFVYPDVDALSLDALNLPTSVKTRIADSSGLSAVNLNFEVGNLAITVDGPYQTQLMKSDNDGIWYLSPPSTLKYIGKTRLFQSSEDWDRPADGELSWDYTVGDPEERGASVFYYNRWEADPTTGEPILSGSWVDFNGKVRSNPPPNLVDFSSLLVYYDGKRLQPGEVAYELDYQIQFNIVPEDGTFEFLYEALTFEGIKNPPRVTISDSITTSFEHDITDLVFSGLVIYAAPNVESAEKLLRVTKFNSLHAIDEKSEINSLRCPNALIAGENSGPGDDNWERYFMRLPIDYSRYGAEWQKVNLLCQGFGYWGSSISPENMTCPAQQEKPEIYEELYLFKRSNIASYIYQEPYLYSKSIKSFSSGEDYDNSMVVPSTDGSDFQVQNARIESYDPLHSRRADTDSPVGFGYGEWAGSYYRSSRCSQISGDLVEDIVYEVLDPVEPPLWDASIYKAPQTCVMDPGSGNLDANHYKIGYAFFVAGMSAAGEAVFEIG